MLIEYFLDLTQWLMYVFCIDMNIALSEEKSQNWDIAITEEHFPEIFLGKKLTFKKKNSILTPQKIA